MIRVTVWNENIHEKEIPEQMAHYPRGIHGAIAEYLQKSPDELDVRIATQDQPACGLPDDVLNLSLIHIYKKNPGDWKGHAGDISTILRIAVTGRRNTPDLCAIMRLLGPDEVRKRLTAAI